MHIRTSAAARSLGAAMLMLGWASNSAAAPYAAIFVDGVEIEIPLTTETIDGVTISYADEFVYSNAEAEVVIHSLVFDPDPSINYAFDVTDFGGASNFNLLFTQPIVLTPAPGVATHDLSGTTIHATLPVTVTPNPPPVVVPVDTDGIPEIAVYTLSTNGGVTLLNADLDLGPMFVGAPPSSPYGPFSEGPVGGPAAVGSYDFMRVDVNFGLEGGARRFQGSGTASVVAPEPSMLSMLASSLALLGLRLRLR
jgi:hypothetical protein